MAGIPGIPQNLLVQTANQQILVSWDLSTGATSYNIQRSQDNVTYATIATVSGSPLATSYLDTAVTLGTQYWYKVAASSLSASINFTGQPIPGGTVIIFYGFSSFTFTAVASSPVGNQFAIGASIAQTILNLSQVINNIIPSLVATAPTPTQLFITALDPNVYDVTSSLTNTTVTPFSVGGISQFTQPASAVPTPTGEMCLSQIRLAAMQRADRVNSNFVTVPEWRNYINQAMFELYDLLITVYEDLYVAPPIQIVADGVTFLYPLPNGSNTFLNGLNPALTVTPPPFYKLLGVDLALNNAVNAFVTVNKFNFADRNRFVYPNTASTIYGVFNLQYRVMGSNIQFIPTPTSGQALRFWYIPRLTELLQETDTTSTGISGWIEYVIVRAAKYALDKEESDSSKLDQELLFLKGRIEESAANRDAGMPDTISDVNNGNWANGWSGGRNGAVGGF
jgi:hypothetical protein